MLIQITTRTSGGYTATFKDLPCSPSPLLGHTATEAEAVAALFLKLLQPGEWRWISEIDLSCLIIEYEA